MVSARGLKLRESWALAHLPEGLRRVAGLDISKSSATTLTTTEMPVLRAMLPPSVP